MIQIAGDSTIDWIVLAGGVRQGAPLTMSYAWERPASVGVCAQPGGAALIMHLLTATCQDEANAPSGPVLSEAVLHNPQDGSLARTFSLWAPYASGPDDPRPAWRIRDFLGQMPATAGQRDSVASTNLNGPLSCLVINDLNLGFRDEPAHWPACLREPAQPSPQILLKMTNPIATGTLWETLAAEHTDRLTVCLALGDFRKEGASIGNALSWEQISTDLLDALSAHPQLTRAARVIVSLGAAGALIAEREGTATLIYDPNGQEGDWERLRPGTTVGLGTCLTVSLALQCLRNAAAPNWREGVCRGLEAARRLHMLGYLPDDPALPRSLHFPLQVADLIRDGASSPSFHTIMVSAGRERWTILGQQITSGPVSLGECIVEQGAQQALPGVPVEIVGAWSSVDRTEIESLRSVRNIMSEYVAQEPNVRPLSLAVFGPPGAGKSYAVKQLAQEWAGVALQVHLLEFNLTQFGGLAELNAALHQVRDCAVRKRLPVVFWDEFDASFEGQPGGWLRYFLAPMQDGVFIEYGLLRPIGQAVFVFAGGTHPTMASFKAAATARPETKATDFLSRLRGYVDVLGVNPAGATDQTFPIRRAFLLRSAIQRKAPQIISDGLLSIDRGVLQAFLQVSQYLHGARSLEAIIDMSALSGKLRFERSCLPAAHQLGLHTDAEDFLRLVRERTANS